MEEVNYNVTVNVPSTNISVKSSAPRTKSVKVTGTQGLRGESAYEAALNEGFVGTKSEWINSLRGSSAYEIALDNGFVGTEEEWIESMTVSVKAEDADKILTNNGVTHQWVTIGDKLNDSTISWDFGEIQGD